MSSEHVEVLRELRDTGDVSDWRAMESALDAAIASLSAPQPPTAPDYPITAECRRCGVDYRCVPVPAKCDACGADLPPSAPVGKTFCEQMEMLRDDFARYSDGDPKVPFVVVREALVAALNEWDALSQQPAADGGFTAADMMDAMQEGRQEAQQPAACVACEGAPGSENSPCAVCGQQPAAVDEAMVERALAAYLRRQEDGESLYGCVTAALTAALAAQPGGSDNDR